MPRRRAGSQVEQTKARQRRDGFAPLDKPRKGQAELEKFFIVRPNAAHGE
jgi:hypothetical protein